jgi:hypothetical protein
MGCERKDGSGSSRVLVGGQALQATELTELQQAAATLSDADLAERIAGETEILDLCTAPDESAYLERLLQIYGTRTQLDFSRMPVPSSKGIKGKLLAPLRRLLWGLMRYPHDWTAFQQNAVNEQAIKALSLAVKEQRRENALLRKRVDALEQAGDTVGDPGRQTDA